MHLQGWAPADQVSPGATWLSLLLYAALTATGFAVFVEWRQYSGQFEWWRLSPRDELILLWVLSSVPLWLVTPVLPIAGAFARAGRPRAAWTLVVTGATLVFAWLWIDLRVNRATGNHIVDYLPFVTWSHPFQWAAGAEGMLRPMLGPLVSLGVILAGLAWLLVRFGRDLTRRWPRLCQRGALAVSSGVYLVMLLGSAPAVHLIRRPPVIQQLQAAMPILWPLLAEAMTDPGDDDPFLARFNLEAGLRYAQLFEQITTVKPADEVARLPDGPRPHVLLVVLESLRRDALDPRWMPRLSAWAQTGLRLTRHHAGGNASELGLFGLLYGRHPLLYESTLDAAVPPQLPKTLRRSGYGTAYFGSGDLHWRRMEEFLNVRHFDRVFVDTEGDWPERDRRTLERVAQLLAGRGDQPWFVTVFLLSTHALYRYPPEYERFTPTLQRFGPFWEQGAPTPEFRQSIVNRYHNALGFTDDIVAGLLDTLDPTRHVVIVTGDHGESFFDDHTWMHLGPLSEIQTHVPMVLRGPGIPSGLIAEATNHPDVLPTVLHALAGGPLRVEHTYGRDVLAGGGSDQVLLSKPIQWGPTIFVRGDRRLQVQLSPRRPRLYAPGFVDASARLRPGMRGRPEEAAAWAAAFTEELERLAR